MSDLKHTVTVTKPVDPQIADLVNFVKHLRTTPRLLTSGTDDELVKAAYDFWDTAHGED